MNNNLIDAIQQVVKPNGKKAISAESLANLLIDIVSAIPEGNGGNGQVVFYMGMPNEDFTETTLTPEQQAHNVEMFNIIKDSPIALSASIDMTDFQVAQGGEQLGIDLSGCKYCISSIMTYYITREHAEAIGMPSESIACDADGVGFYIFPDGALLMEM